MLEITPRPHRAQRVKRENYRRFERSLAPYLPAASDPEAWYLKLAFNANGDIPAGVGAHSFASYVAMLPQWLADQPKLMQIFAALELYGTPECSGHMAREVEDITRGRQPWPSILEPWKTLRELLYHHGECGLFEHDYPRPGWLDAPGPRSLVIPPMRSLRFKSARR